MKTKPILFSTLMVQAILAGRKTQTRRIVKPQPYIDKMGNFCVGDSSYGQDGRGNPSMYSFIEWHCPYGKVGDLLWVRETFTEEACATDICYKADFPIIWPKNQTDGEEIIQKAEDYKFKPSIFMLRRDSRITLEITDIRVERLQHISEKDAKAEGIIQIEDGFYQDYMQIDADKTNYNGYMTAGASYFSLWDSINGVAATKLNPWVWVVEFKPHFINVDDFIKTEAA